MAFACLPGKKTTAAVSLPVIIELRDDAKGL